MRRREDDDGAPRLHRVAPQQLPTEGDEEARLPVVGYLPPLCPDCGRRGDCYGVRGRKRYHLCRDCRRRFMSIEVADARDLMGPPFRPADGAR